MKRLVVSMAVVLSCSAPARGVAGPNAGGVLILHTNDAITYCQDHTSYCGDFSLESCEAIDNSAPAEGNRVFWVLAAFPVGSSPRLAGVTFGIHYSDAAVFMVAHGTCGDFELGVDGWPADGGGVAVTWNTARTTLLTPVYWFAAYDYDGGPHADAFRIDHFPGNRANFGDDSVPQFIDPVYDFGTLGFGAPGTTPCPVLPPETGACCFSDGSCSIATPAGCIGIWIGPGTDCDPDPCPPTLGACCFEDGHCAVWDPSTCAEQGGTYGGDWTNCYDDPCPPTSGACCFANGSCQVMTAGECVSQGGTYSSDNTGCNPNPCPQPPVYGACCLVTGECVITIAGDCTGEYQGDNTSCDPNPCTPPVPTENMSWGSIKRRYR